MAFLRVLVPLALFVVITLAEYPSPNTFLDNEVIQYEESKSSSEESKKSKDFKPSIDIENSNYAEKKIYRLNNKFYPDHYDIRLKINLTNLSEKDYRYQGEVNINMSGKDSNTQEIQLHSDKSFLKLDDKKAVIFNEKGEKIGVKITEVNNTNILTLKADKDLVKSEKYVLKLVYEGRVSDKNHGFYKGSYLNSEGKMRWYVATHFEPIGARTAFPCFDEPALKATFNISITYNKGYKAISNMNGETVPVEDDQQMTSFERTPKMSTYLVAYAITDFESTPKDKVTVYSRPEAINMTKYAVEVGKEVLVKLEKYTGIDYPSTIGKIDQIALPLLSAGAMENWGLVTYRETTILYDKNVNTTIESQRVPDIIAHEFAHQWFGNLVTPAWWEDIWLNEGFATYFQYFIVDQINPDWRYMDQFNVLSLQSRAFVYDANGKKTRAMNSKEKNENEIDNLFDNIAYDKAAAVIRMFSHVLGKTKFQEGLQKYLKENSVVTSEKLYKSLELVVDKKTLPDKVTLQQILESWVTQPGYPVISVTKDKQEKKVTIEQKQFYLVEPTKKETKWYIPLNYVQQEKGNFDDTSVMLWLTPDKKSIEITNNIEKESWIIFNVQQTGYYRVNYDEETWNNIIDYMKRNFTRIHPLNRAQLIDDAFNLAQADLLNINITFNLIKYLEQETDYIVWKAAFNGLSKLNNLLGGTKLNNEFLKFVKPITKKLLDTVKFLENKNDTHLTKLLRVDAVKWACDTEYEPFKTYATEKFNLWLKEAKNVNTISRDLKKIIFCGALKKADVSSWSSILNKYILSTDSEEKAVYLSSLGCSSSPEILKKFLHIAVQKDSNFKGHLSEVFRTVYSNSAIGAKIVLNFINTNLNKLQLYDNKENIMKYLTDLAKKIAIEEDVKMLKDIISQLKDATSEAELNEILDIANRNYFWYKYNDKNLQTLFEEKNPTSKPTSKPNGANSLSFSIALIAVSLLIVRLR